MHMEIFCREVCMCDISLNNMPLFGAMYVCEVFSAVVMLIISFGTSMLVEYQFFFKIIFPSLLSAPLRGQIAHP